MFFLLLLTAVFGLTFINFSVPPFEDAAILMRYADHFANGHGIVWNIGEPPVDGATDFLFMIVLGFLVKAGLTLDFATRLIGISSHIATVWIVYLASTRLFTARLWPALVNATCLVVGPGLSYVAAYFGTPFFALFACITWYVALTTILKGESRNRAVVFAGSALMTALIRPEGVILTSLMLVAIVYFNSVRPSRQTILFFLAAFLFIGGAYFLWRWHYFGYPLPNPFYKKARYIIYPGSLRTSVLNTLKFSCPFLLAFIASLYSVKSARWAIGISIPIAGFASAFVLISDEMNFGSRFQYVLLPLVLMCWWPLTEPLKRDLRFLSPGDVSVRKRTAMVLIAVTVGVGAIYYAYEAGRKVYYRDGKYDVAMMLSDYRDKGFVMATSEAGLLPLYSQWRALDTWGLNDQWIAHNGRITEEYLTRFEPELIVFYAYYSPLVPWEGARNWAWYDMVMTLEGYAEKNGYVLAAAFGDSPYQTHYYYVRPGREESAEIIERIRSIDYYWSPTGRKAVNYATVRKTPDGTND